MDSESPTPEMPEEDGNEAILSHAKEPEDSVRLYWKLGVSFFLFGLINNGVFPPKSKRAEPSLQKVLYVVILSAALDLVPSSTPKGLILFCDITPAVVAKVAWPYFLKGRIRYKARLIGCCAVAVFGMLVVALFDSVPMRLLGIACASFASGLGEITFLQLATTFAPLAVSSHSIGYFSSGTGAAGLVGAFLWWQVKGLGVKRGVLISALFPFVMPVTFFGLLPHQSSFHYADTGHGSAYTQLPAADLEPLIQSQGAGTIDNDGVAPAKTTTALSLKDKWAIVRPMLGRYMIPLFLVYLFEYTINQGISPTLIYPVPSDSWLFSKFIHSIRDYYPLWQLIYQSTVFLSRSSVSLLRLPPLPRSLLPLPATIQALILVVLGLESAFGIFRPRVVDGDATSIMWVLLLVALEGICGGLAYVNVYHHANQISQSTARCGEETERDTQEREFAIGSLGLADSFGILCASLLAMPVEIQLCRIQVERGKTFCKQL